MRDVIPRQLKMPARSQARDAISARRSNAYSPCCKTTRQNNTIAPPLHAPRRCFDASTLKTARCCRWVAEARDDALFVIHALRLAIAVALRLCAHKWGCMLASHFLQKCFCHYMISYLPASKFPHLPNEGADVLRAHMIYTLYLKMQNVLRALFLPIF